MKITPTPELETMIGGKVESGHNNTSSEVVHEALRLMERRDTEGRLWVALAVGLDELDRDKTVEYTPELLAEVDREADRLLAEGVALDPDVCP
jgi:putative addiction module CopG family antidote